MIESRVPRGMIESELEMSNFDHSIDDGLELALRRAPREVCCRHSAMNFNAVVWYDERVNKFKAEVWVYQVLRGMLEADTLEQLMEITNQEYGYD